MGKINPVLVALIIDQYLSDNKFSQTRSTFRNEASSLFAYPLTNQSSLSLEQILDEYMCLKEQKVMLYQQRVEVMQEKNQIRMLSQGIQNAMNAYNAFQRPPSPNVKAMNTNSVVIPQSRLSNETPPGVSIVNTYAETGNLSTPMISVSGNRRKDTLAMNVPPVAKKPRGRPPGSRKIPKEGQATLLPSSNAINDQVFSRPPFPTQSSYGNLTPNESQAQGSIGTQCLFNGPSVPVPTNSPVSMTPPRTHCSHSDTYVSHPKISPVATCNGEVTPSCCNVISNKRVTVSPADQMFYTESSRCISPVTTDSDEASEKNHVMGRLHASEMHESLNISDIDEYIDWDKFLLSDELSNPEIHYEGIFPDHSAWTHIKDNASDPHECNANQVCTSPTVALKKT